MGTLQRKIIHCDADCFFAALEERDNPRYRGRPIAVGGHAEGRGVIATCNYAARTFGVRSAMPSAQALKLCPDLLIVRHRMEVYREASEQMREIFADYTDLIEPLSLDEAFLDVTGANVCLGSASLIAQEIRARVHKRVGITVSAGVSVNKFLAKVASDWRKPDGLTVIPPKRVADFVRHLPVRKIPGVGPVMQRKMAGLGVETCVDLQAYDAPTLQEWFGCVGESLHQLSFGRDDREVTTERQRKSVSVEQTFSADLPDLSSCMMQMAELMPRLQHRLDALTREGGCIDKAFVKLKFNDFSSTTLERKGTQPRISVYRSLCEEAYSRGLKPVRLMGLGVRIRSQPNEAVQLPLFGIAC